MAHVDPVSAFRDAMAAAGINTPDQVVADGKLRRFHVEGDRRGTKHGWYVLYLDGLPAGSFGSWKLGVRHNWHAETNGATNDEERALLRARIDAARRQRAQEDEQRRQRAAEKARRMWEQANPADPEHPYLVARQVRPHGIRQLGSRLVIPVRDADGKFTGLQFIGAEAEKRFLTDTAKKGAYHRIGVSSGVVIICEGYATGASVHEATGHAVAVAFDAGNLRPVAEAVRAKVGPDTRIILAADDDHKTEGNPGVTKARDAARVVSGTVAIPRFPAGDVGTDWNDLARSQGITAVRDGITRTLHPRIPQPMSMRDLLAVEDPENRDIADGLIPADANILIAAYPKSHKTNTILELAVAAASATPFLGRFRVQRPHRIGLVLMEDAAHRVRRRIQRMCKAHGVDPESLDGLIHIWFRPPLRLADAEAVQEMHDWARDLALDLLAIDNWSYVASGNSNDADEVTPQLAAFSSIRGANPGMSVLLVQHARKQGQDRNAERLTDVIRNSSAFGAWYDAGLVLARPDEQSPVTIRAELRDRPAPTAFTFVVEDEHPGNDLYMPSGYLRLQSLDKPPALVQRDAAADQLAASVLAFVQANPNTSKRRLRMAVKGDNAVVDHALERLVEKGFVVIEQAGGPGKPSRIRATVLDRAATVLAAHPGGTVLDRAAPTPKGGGAVSTPSTSGSDGDGVLDSADPFDLIDKEDL